MSYENEILMHHGIKGQKWGVRKYKEARSRGINASKMNQEAAGRRHEASKRYVQNTNKMYENAYKRDTISNQLKSVKPNSAKASRYTSKMNEYDSKAKAYSDKRNAAEKDYNNADKDVAKYADAYKSALKEAANQKVEIKKHTLGRTLVMGAFHMPYSPSSKDTFDEDVMTYRSVNHVKHSDVQASDSIEHHGIKGQKWGVRKKSRVTLSEVPDNAIIRTRKKISKKYRAEAAKNHLYDLRNSEGKKIGNLNLYDESKKSMNVVWVGVNSKHRGQGYATDAMRQVIDLANKKKMSQITLEVPGGSPDAHHIYKKLGFKDDKKVSSDDDYWGGLTSMKKELKHMDTPFGQDSIEHHGVKGMKWGQHKVTRVAGGSTGSSIGAHIQTRYANKARAKQWRSQYNNRGKMSTEELRRAVNRLNLENQFDVATKQAMASSSKTVFSKYKDQYINGAIQGAVNNTNQVGNRVGQAAARAMIKRIGMAAAASV